MGLRTALAVMTLLPLGCAVDVVESGAEQPPTATEVIAVYQQAMCLDDFRVANMTTAWQNTTMYPHEGAYCSSCHGGGRERFFAPRIDLLDPLERERQFFAGLKTSAENLASYVTPGIDAEGTYTMAVNRGSFEAIAAGAFRHERFILDEQPGPRALQLFHDKTMARLASGTPCGAAR